MLDVEDRLKDVEEKLDSGLSKDGDRRGQITIFVAVVLAFASLITSAVTTYLQGRSGVSLEQAKFRYALIRNSLAGSEGSKTAVAEQLAFLVDLGLLEDEKGAIAKMVANPSSIPVKTLEERMDEQGSQLSMLLKYVACVDKGVSSGRRYVFDLRTLECLELPSGGEVK